MSTPFAGSVQVIGPTGPVAGALVDTFVSGTLTAQAAYTTAAYTTPTSNPVVCDSSGRATVWLRPDLTYRVRYRNPDGTAIPGADWDGITGDSDAQDAGAISYQRPGGAATTVAAHLLTSVNAILDYGVPNNGTTSATATIQAMFNACAESGNVREIYFPPGTYLVTNPRSDDQITSAIVISGLKRCTIRGAKGTKFIVNASGSGVSQFGFIRIEQCEDLEFCHFEFDGSGIVNTTDVANRSRCFTLCSYDVNATATDLPNSNARIEFHHIYAHDVGGFVEHVPRNIALPPCKYLAGLSVHDNLVKNLTNVNHGVACPYSYNVEVYNNTFIQDFAAITPIDCMAVDASIGAENVSVRNNYVSGFVFGMKCEAGTNYGVGANETRTSVRVVFENNYLDQIGDPVNLIWPGPGGGGTYGIKLNGVDCIARGNTIKPRTTGATTGGLYIGVLVQNKHVSASHAVVEGNRVIGAKYGVLHDDIAPTTRLCTVTIDGNRLEDNGEFGALIQSNCTFENNEVHRAGQSAVVVQVADMTFVRDNRFFNCASVDNAVIPDRVVVYQSTVGATGYFEIVDNVIIDTRGGSAGEYGYFLRGGTTYTNSYVFRPGYTTGLVTGVTVDRYASVIGDSTQLSATLNPPPRLIRSSNTPASTAPWSGMTWNVGDRAVRETPEVGQAKAWSCTVAGTPGTWVSEGVL